MTLFMFNDLRGWAIGRLPIVMRKLNAKLSLMQQS
jgi:hypothetical protein